MEKTDHTLIVGDIHGCFNEWMLLLKKAGYHPQAHRLILVGDLINKGPDSFKVLKWAYQNKTEQVIGNHEMKFLHLIQNEEPLPPSLQKLKTEIKDQTAHWIQFIKSWPTYIETKDFLVVHAGIVPGEHPKDSKIEDITNIRYWNPHTQSRSSSKNTLAKPWHEFYTEEKLVVYGHWAKQGFLKKSNSIGLDSGCVYGHKLSGVCLPSRKIIQVDSFQKIVLESN